MVIALCARAQLACVVGSQWGDEGKGKLSDVLAKKCVACIHP